MRGAEKERVGGVVGRGLGVGRREEGGSRENRGTTPSHWQVAQRGEPPISAFVRAPTEERWAQGAARGLRLGMQAVRVAKGGPGSQWPWHLAQLPVTGTPKITTGLTRQAITWETWRQTTQGWGVDPRPGAPGYSVPPGPPGVACSPWFRWCCSSAVTSQLRSPTSTAISPSSARARPHS